MTTVPRVSAIIIFLNEARFLREAIASVFAQTHECWELLLVDDGSTDGSATIATEYARDYPDRVRYLAHPGRANRGMSASRNLGLRHARGEFVGFLDGDDVWLPEKLGEQVAILDRVPEVEMVYGRTLIWHSWDSAPTARSDDFLYELGVEPDHAVKPPQLLVNLIKNRHQTPTTCNALMRKPMMRKVGGFENSFRGLFEDQVFFAKICASHDVFVASPVWAKYRQHEGSCSAITERDGEVRRARLQFLEWLKSHLQAEDSLEPQVAETLKAEIRACRFPAFQKVHQAVTGPRISAILKWGLILLPVLLVAGYSAMLDLRATRAVAEGWLLENGPVELATFAFFSWAAIRSLWLVRRHRHHPSPWWVPAFFSIFAVAMFVIAMEEIAWGQQFVDIETPAFFAKWNVQGQITLHNLKGHNSAVDLGLFGLAGLAGILAGTWSRLRVISSPVILASWFLTVGVFGFVDFYNDHQPIGARMDNVIEWVGELVEMLAGASAILYVELKRLELRRRASSQDTGTLSHSTVSMDRSTR